MFIQDAEFSEVTKIQFEYLLYYCHLINSQIVLDKVSTCLAKSGISK